MPLTPRDINDIERTHADGLSSVQILDLLSTRGSPISAATLRKYVQLGLLPRSRRVGVKGKHRGSHGIYPVEVIRRIDEIRRAMDGGDTLESLSVRTQGVRARLDAVRVELEDVLNAAESDLEGRMLDRKARTDLRAILGMRGREAKGWLRAMEKWSSELEEEQVRSTRNGKTSEGKTKTSLRRRT